MLNAPSINKNIKLKTELMIRSAKLRITKQRCAVLQTILESSDHPTASMIYQRSKEKASGLSLATVYNCLESMAEARIINHLHFDNGPSRYCSNEISHAHVVDEKQNKVIDVHLKKGVQLQDVFDLPNNVCIQAVDIYLRAITARPL